MQPGNDGSPRNVIAAFREALYSLDDAGARAALRAAAAPDAVFHHCHPFGDLIGPDAFFDQAIAPLAAAMPDLERRDFILITGDTAKGATWVGCAGYYMGTFARPWMGIPATGHLAAMRYHEYFRIENGMIVEFQAIWDLPELMMQAGVWPMVPSLGRDWQVPAPATQDGIANGARDPDESAASRQLVLDMLTAMSRHPSERGPDVMEMDRFWHPHMNWYGPAGIGTARGIAGFRKWHQIPFLSAMPDRGQHSDGLVAHFFAEGQYVGVTGWPDMRQTLSHAGWLGLPPVDKMITLRSLDFWRLENGLIRENWVLVDLLHMYDQLGVDVMARMAELVSARPGAAE